MTEDESIQTRRLGAGRIIAGAIAFVLGLPLLALYTIMRFQRGEGVVGFWQGAVTVNFGKTWESAIRVPLWLSVLVVSSLLIVMLMTSRLGRSFTLGLIRRSGGWLLLALGLLLFSLLPLHYEGLRFVEPGYWILTALLLGTGGFALVTWGAYPLLRKLGRSLLVTWYRIERVPLRWYLLTTGGVTLTAAIIFNFVVLENTPHINDGIAQLFHARILASGRLFLQSPVYPSFFDFTHLINNGHWYSQYPFGHPLMLAIGVLLRVPWLINPLQGSLTVVLFFFLGREVYSERVGRLASLFGALCPFIWFLSGSYMNHVTALLFGTLFMFLFLRIPRRGLGNALLAGLALGMVGVTRPGTALCIGLPFALYGLVQLLRRRGRLLLARYAVAAAGVGFMLGLLLLHNQVMNGEPLLFGYEVLHGPNHGFVFGSAAFKSIHTPFRGLVHQVNNLNGINRYLFEWPFPSLALVMLLLGAGGAVRSGRSKDWLLLAPLALILFIHFFYFWHGFGYGPRFLYATIPGLILLSARALVELPRITTNIGMETRPARVRSGAAAAMLFAFLVAMSVSAPAQARSYRGFCDTSGRILRAARNLPDRTLVFSTNPHNTFLGNRIDFEGALVFANDAGTPNAMLAAAYPDYTCYHADDNTLQPLPGLQERARLLEVDLHEAFTFAVENARPEHLYLLWPFEPPLHMPPVYKQLQQERFRSHRSAHLAILSDRSSYADFAPSLSVWVREDKRRYEKVEAFQGQNDGVNYIQDDLRFTLLHTSANGLVMVFDVRTAMEQQPEPPGTYRVPVK